MKTSSIVRFRRRTQPFLAITTISALIGFLWPFINGSDGLSILLLLATPASLLLIFIMLGNQEIDSKSIALLGILSALLAALRPLGAGAIGIEPMWFLLILAARVFGASFGFILGAMGMLASAFITGGFGPWLPYQVFAAALIGCGAGWLPQQVRGLGEIFLLTLYSIFAALLFGLLMDLQFWPWALGTKTQLSYLPGASISTNFIHFISYHFLTSLAWDLPRAIFTSLLIISTAKPVLNALRRTLRKAAFEEPVTFTERVKAQAEER